MVRREGPGGSLSVDKQLLALSVHHMLLDLGNVVRHVVDDVHVQVFWGLVEDFGKCLASQEGHRGAVHPGVVRCRRHTLHIILAFLRIYSGACQLPVIGLDVVAGHGALHLNQGVCGDLVAQTSAARVDHDANLALLVDTHLFGDEWVVDLVDNLDLRIVVASSEGSQLRQASLLGTAGDLGRIRVQHPPVLLAMLLVLRPCVPLAERPINA
mmetsp:Transcript_23153/g.57605  ORF Transcript_23153/g.57605 Transcript_23153/m.57605 type:complete len:212 (-) Transcript_23153:621-1256(-)